MLDAESLALFGLKMDPFGGPWKRPLTPGSLTDETALYAEVEGFGRAVPEIRRWAKNVLKERRFCLCVLIQGSSGSGLTSTANLIAYLTLSEALSKGGAVNARVDRALLGENMTAVSITDSHELLHVKQGIIDFNDRLADLGLGLAKDPNLAESYRAAILTQAPQSSDAYQDIFNGLARTLIRENGKSILLFEGAKTNAQALNIFSVFRKATVVIVTTEQEVLSEAFSQKLIEHQDQYAEGLLVKLGALDSDDLHNLVRHRWEQCADPATTPLQFKGLERLKGRRIKTVSLVLGEIFSKHADRVRKGHSDAKIIEDTFFLGEALESLTKHGRE